jgi:K+ transporter
MQEIKHHSALSKVSFAGLLITIGIVFGDIGTSPLYVVKAIISGQVLFLRFAIEPILRQVLFFRFAFKPIPRQVLRTGFVFDQSCG